MIGRECLAIVLTGMGDDGSLGAARLHALGATVLAQSAETCVVYGMPKAVVESGAAAAAMPPLQIRDLLASLVAHPARRGAA